MFALDVKTLPAGRARGAVSTAEPIACSPSTVAPAWRRLDGLAERVIARQPPEELR